MNGARTAGANEGARGGIVAAVAGSRLARAALPVVVLTALGAVAVAAFGLDGLRAGLEASREEIRAHPVVSAAALFLWSFVLFLTILPLGTATILLAGALMGPWAGWVQFVALVAAGQALFEWSGAGAQQRAVAEIARRPRLSALLRGLQARGFATTAALRIAPVVPPAFCALACAGLNVSRAKFFGGTVLAGWVRPVFFALVGAGVVSTLGVY